MEYDDIVETLKHYYEVDLGNCHMSHAQWIEELAEALSNPNYLENLKREYKQYLNDR